MAEGEKQTQQPYGESDDSYALLWVGVPFCAMIIATGALYLGRPVLLPLAIALILSVVFSPVASRLDRYFGRLVSAALVVLVAIGLLTAMGYFLTIELTSVADQVAGYSDNIGNKLAALEKNTPPWLQHIQEAVTEVQRRVASANAAPAAARQPREVMALPVPAPLSDSLKPVIPIVDGLVNALLIIMLLFFLLYSRKDLRDRFVRLAARARIPIAAQAIETAGATVGHYLLLFSLINLAYGIATGTVAWMLGLPSAPLWGLVATAATRITRHTSRILNGDPAPVLAPVTQPAASHAPEPDGTIRRILADAHAFYTGQLAGSWAPGYLHARGITAVAIQNWHIGYAPAGWTALTSHLCRLGHHDDAIQAAGLATRSSRGTLIDRFRDRDHALPVHDAAGMLAGFTGRAHPDAGPDTRNTSTAPRPPPTRRATCCSACTRPAPISPGEPSPSSWKAPSTPSPSASLTPAVTPGWHPAVPR